MGSNWTIRTAEPGDINYIYSTWLKSYRYDSAIGVECQNSIFFPEYNKVIDRILKAPETTTSIMCLPEDPSFIMGYLVSEPSKIHYMFTRETLREKGVARSLVHHFFGEPAPELETTHRTYSIDPILEKHKTITFNPFILFKKEESHV